MAKHPHLVLLGTCIRKLREEREYSQDDFALHIGMDRTYYSGVERGERNIAARNLIRIARGLQVEVGELFPRISQLSEDERS